MSRQRAVAMAALPLAALTACARPSSLAGPPRAAGVFANPVIAGDHPDPSVIRVGREYWATATSSQWGPPFPLLRSRDLVSWEVVGSVLARPPAWSNGSYWAPEIAAHDGRYFVYYTARRRDGPLCVAVATAARPGGPYRDHGPMVCQEVGSIDAVPVSDENGERWLVWKEDGNSRQRPTPLWAQRLDASGTRLAGEAVELFRNDQPWEGALVEGPFLLRRGGFFYMFYSGNACCGRACNYALGVARARRLLGPWEKNPANPILRGNERWKCPGHGSIVTGASGGEYLLYHAYDPEDFVYVGRQALLDRIEWGTDGWPAINGGAGPTTRSTLPSGARAQPPPSAFEDEFRDRPQPGWQWPQAAEPVVRLDTADGGWLVLSPPSARAADPIGAVLGRSTTSGHYAAVTRVSVAGLASGASAGLSAYGNEANAVGLSVRDGRAYVWRRVKGQHAEDAGVPLPPGASVYLRVVAREGHRFRFAVSADGRGWTDVGGEVGGEHLPPWDLAVRIALTAGGAAGAAGRFDFLRVEPAP
jgi:beta-xylosidase